MIYGNITHTHNTYTVQFTYMTYQMYNGSYGCVVKCFAEQPSVLAFNYKVKAIG